MTKSNPDRHFTSQKTQRDSLLAGLRGDNLLTSARQAFTPGLNVVCLLAAVLSVALAELAVL